MSDGAALLLQGTEFAHALTVSPHFISYIETRVYRERQMCRRGLTGTRVTNGVNFEFPERCYYVALYLSLYLPFSSLDTCHCPAPLPGPTPPPPPPRGSAAAELSLSTEQDNQAVSCQLPSRVDACVPCFRTLAGVMRSDLVCLFPKLHFLGSLPCRAWGRSSVNLRDAVMWWL